MKRFLIPIDGSEGSILALRKGMELANKYDESEITLLHAAKDFREDMPNFDENLCDEEKLDKLFDLAFQQGEEVLNEAKSILKEYNGNIKTIVEVSDPAKLIIKTAENSDYDLIVMGNRGLSMFSRVMLGSVSSRVMNHVETSIYIVKS